ncbi:hypothetical protein Cch01nite_08540 [Cellulomonas chitinilytica]|uniref:Uncharacterized protein n=1 Tax=Cellulomonas chitinilytica TaxID=398759 RepID=A0A919P0R9_9CELL|nr:hypothetical protein [Cellulomonas chitinilytica]GIG20130.1 hypothetical protein Cch01nite_08540 [Cellulomonas chitinilytica]
MRIYLPATLDELGSATFTLAARRAHAVTPALRAAIPDEDDEGLEFLAQLAAADDSLVLLADRPDAPRLRVVVSVDVPERAVVTVVDEDVVPSAVDLLDDLGRDDVACVHVDEPAAREDVRRAADGDEAALDALDERDLLWYDASELGRIPR